MASRSDPTGNSPRRLGRILRALYREAFRRRLPHGLINWRYLRPGTNERLRLHRHFWWASGRRWPRAAWYLVETWHWLRWLLWYGWRASGHAVRHFGPAVTEELGIPAWRQYLRVLRLALGWSIYPADIYRFRLIERPDAILDYVFDHEAGAYHQWRSEPLGLKPSSIALLQDKVGLATKLNEIGVPMVATADVVPRGTLSIPLVEQISTYARVFCKRRSGNRGRDAFAAWHTTDGLRGHSFSGQPLTTTREVEQAWKALLTADDALIQPYLDNHPVLAQLAFDDMAITVRFITYWENSELACLSATLEVPATHNPLTKQIEYAILPIHPETGEVQPLPPHVIQTTTTRFHTEQLRQRGVGTIPCWAALAQGSYDAHVCFPDVYAIAWDWVVTAGGPVLLEGNTGWGITTPQMFGSGLLADRGTLHRAQTYGT